MNNIKFISPLYDSTFKALWKSDSSRKWVSKLIKYITNIDLDNYSLYDPELNSGNGLKDYRLDILFINEEIKSTVNVEMYKNYHSDDSKKSFQYIFSILSKDMKKGDKYTKRRVVQVNFNDGYFESNKDVNIICYKIVDETNTYEQEYLKVYDVFLSNYKDFCYNEVDELDAMLSFLQANSYDEMRRIANGNKEALNIVKELEKLALEEKFIGIYNAEEEQRRMMNAYYDSGKSEGYEEGFNQGEESGKKASQEEVACKMLEDGMDIRLVSKYSGLSNEEISKLISK